MFAGFRPDGNVYFGSYRDPNLKKTIENYDASPEYISTFEAGEEKMLGYIIGTVSRLDNPLTVSGKGNAAYGRFFTKYTKEQQQTERDAVLSTTAEDIKTFNKLISEGLKQNIHCVYGNKEKIESNKELFDNILNLENN